LRVETTTFSLLAGAEETTGTPVGLLVSILVEEVVEAPQAESRREDERTTMRSDGFFILGYFSSKLI
jgi:hypothetical protein